MHQEGRGQRLELLVAEDNDQLVERLEAGLLGSHRI
jgi:hypothetical protein